MRLGEETSAKASIVALPSVARSRRCWLIGNTSQCIAQGRKTEISFELVDVSLERYERTTPTILCATIGDSLPRHFQPPASCPPLCLTPMTFNLFSCEIR